MCLSCRFLALLAIVAIVSGTYGYRTHQNTVIVTVESGESMAALQPSPDGVNHHDGRNPSPRR